MDATFTSKALTDTVKWFVPELTADMYKGQCGRIAIVGGCKQFPGAAYFAAITALKVGADIIHVFCTSEAALAVRAYSPDLTVHGVLDDINGIEEAGYFMDQTDVLVVGPGLIRGHPVFRNVKELIQKAIHSDIPVVIDAHAIFFIMENQSLIKGYRKAVLTPNAREFRELYQHVFLENNQTNTKYMASSSREKVKKLANELGVTIVCKGVCDVISNGNYLVTCSVAGSNKRCACQGDFLAGALGTFLFWAHAMKESNSLCTTEQVICGQKSQSMLENDSDQGQIKKGKWIYIKKSCEDDESEGHKKKYFAGDSHVKEASTMDRSRVEVYDRKDCELEEVQGHTGKTRDISEVESHSSNMSDDAFNILGPNICAVYGACYLTRECNKLAFRDKKRHMTITDMIAFIQKAFQDNFE